MNIKNLTTLLVFAVMVMCAFLACADSRGRHNDELFSNRWDAPDSVARLLMGNKLSELISNPKKVVMYTVVYRDSMHRDNELVEPDFVLDSMVCKLSKEQVSTLNFMLVADSANYKVDTLAVPMIPHRPAYAFNYTNKKDTAIVWYSPGDFTWGIRYDGRDMFWYNVANPSILNRFCQSLTR